MNTKLLLLLGGGAVVLWWWEQQQKKPASTTSTPAPGAAAPPTAVGSPAPSDQFAQTLDRIKNAISSSGVSSTFIYGLQSSDTWNWYAMQAIPGWTAPAPDSIYPGTPDPHRPVAFMDWWARVQKFLPSGLSGFQPRSALFNQVYGGWIV